MSSRKKDHEEAIEALVATLAMARQMAQGTDHAFLAYLIAMAEEEARRGEAPDIPKRGKH